ncbi:MAG: metal ABC transporter substrate-binding protein [Vagococcus sp.]|uniref:metal ABC transporter substrate-binding protein n=1 Tax=Vagococcus sp. TaxID=1933889 RepID=UPI002FCC7A85
MKKYFKIMMLVGAMFSLAACAGTKQESKKEDKLNIVTTFYPMYDFADKIVQDKGNVSMLIDGGVEPHDYEPSPKDMAKIQEADVFIYNSHEMETWVESVLKNIDTSKVKVIEASKGIELLEGSHEESEGEDEKEDGHSHAVDPHVWLDPVLVQKEVETISKGIIAVDEKNKDSYTKNTADFNKKLETLNQNFESNLKEAKNREFVTQHMAFSYLAHRYNLKQVPISGLSPDQEPTPKELKQIEDFVKNKKIEIIYTESSASPKIAKTISDATGANLDVLNPMENLSKKERENGADYISVMEKNLEALKKSIK